MSFFGKIGGFFKHLIGNAHTWERAASLTLTIVMPLAQTLITLTAGPGVSAEVGGIIGKIQAGLKAVNDVVVSSGPVPTVKSTLDGVLINLKELEDSAEIKNSANATAVQLVVTTLIGEVEAIMAELPAATATA
jgi:hypothetical protein